MQLWRSDPRGSSLSALSLRRRELSQSLRSCGPLRQAARCSCLMLGISIMRGKMKVGERMEKEKWIGGSGVVGFARRIWIREMRGHTTCVIHETVEIDREHENLLLTVESGLGMLVVCYARS